VFESHEKLLLMVCVSVRSALCRPRPVIILVGLTLTTAAMSTSADDQSFPPLTGEQTIKLIQ
jgi:hypothetical protein